MKAELFFDEVLIESRPAAQTGQSRGSEPSPLSGKICGPSTSLIFSRTSVIRSSAVSATAAEKSRQNFSSTAFHSTRPPEMSSSSSSSAAVKSYSR